MSSLFCQKSSPVDRIPKPRIAQRWQLLPYYAGYATRFARLAAPWGVAGVTAAVWLTYPAWREEFKDRAIPGYAAFHGHVIPVEEPKKK